MRCADDLRCVCLFNLYFCGGSLARNTGILVHMRLVLPARSWWWMCDDGSGGGGDDADDADGSVENLYPHADRWKVLHLAISHANRPWGRKFEFSILYIPLNSWEFAYNYIYQSYNAHPIYPARLAAGALHAQRRTLHCLHHDQAIRLYSYPFDADAATQVM